MTKSATQLPLLPTSSPAAGKILNGLNDRQKQAVVEPHQCLIVLAGPGSGKTRVLTHRIAYLIKEGVNPYNILAVTFTNKAAREMRTRLENLLDAGRVKAVMACTFHSFGAWMLRVEMPHLIPLLPNLMFTTMDRRDFRLPQSRLSNDFSIYDSSDQLALMTHIIKDQDRLNLDPKRFKPRDVHAGVSRWKNMGLTPANADLIRAAEDDHMTRIYRNAYLLYQADLLAANALDFDDLILYPLLLFRNQTDRLRRYQDRFRHILIDEYQDTNTVQYELANLMAAHNLYIVGDPDQAIYGFRCGDARNVQRLMQEHPHHSLVLLEQNYRSVAPILQAANRLIENNTQRVPKRLWTTQTSPDHSHIFPCACGDEVAEAEQVARLIKEAAGRGVSYGEMAVLARINAMTREIERTLLNNRVPYELFRGTAFFERMEVKDTLSYLQFVYNGDQVAFQRIANKPKRGLGDVAVKAIIRAADGDLLGWLGRLLEKGQGLAETDPGWQKVARGLNLERVRAGQMFQLWKFAEAVLTVRRLVEKDAAADEVVRQVIALLRSHLETLENFDERWENVQELLTVATRVEPTGLDGLAEFLEQTALGTPEDDFEGTNKVAVATMHAAKGLEFELVFIIGVEDEICPLKRSTEETGQDGVEEERRLFYVAVTRAKKELYLLWTHQRTLFGNTMDGYPSPYFEEMDLEPFGNWQS